MTIDDQAFIIEQYQTLCSLCALYEAKVNVSSSVQEAVAIKFKADPVAQRFRTIHDAFTFMKGYNYAQTKI